MKLEINNVSKYYGKKAALKNFSAELTPGIYGFLGPNGAGKSTLLNIITDNLAASSGRVMFNGVDVTRFGGEYRSKLGFMPQQRECIIHSRS